MSSADIVSALRKFDAYPKTLDDFRIKTFGGATVTILSGIIMTLLFVSELQAYLSPDVSEELFVDTSRGTKLRINLDIIIPSISCEFLVLDAMDTSGEQHLHIEHNIYKRRLDKSGNPVEEPRKEDLGATITGAQDTNTTKETCGSCYGAGGPNECCNTCEAVKQAYRRKQWAIDKLQDVKQCQVENYSDKLKTAFTEACQIYGYMEVNRVGGSFHIAPGQSFSINHVHVHDVQPFSSSNFNTSHRITHLSFGKNIPGKTNPIDGTEVVTHEGSTMFQYYVKIVPTTYVSKDNTILLTNQFSVTRHQKVISTISGESGMPGIFFNYELAPMMVKYTERERSFGHFATNVCAIIGGVFTVAGLIDSLLYHSYKAIQKKIELGKVN
ncbi:endoplasmic reticulum-Golgi intermediate compartment protein 3 isoform X2 [Schistocerca piceifrons]|uniref:endoplasmic reticulum-Golgi intermediate compartment protein 3 isoform X2 n=1 Tax=Schistocerca piceifrons TaxID=274613 RepID=UPI001F5E856A|nr:endoplasmic reticulum-Golgi intermediate compartment protein 3 isoform X2 [Schistocerca piceifrons]